MKMKRICKKIIARVLTAVMLVSVFSTVDMGWNVSKVQAADITVIPFVQGGWYTNSDIEVRSDNTTAGIEFNGPDRGLTITAKSNNITIKKVTLSKVPTEYKEGWMYTIEIWGNDPPEELSLNDWTPDHGTVTGTNKITGEVNWFKDSLGGSTKKDGFSFYDTIIVDNINSGSVRIVHSNKNVRIKYGVEVVYHKCSSTEVTYKQAYSSCTQDGWKEYYLCSCGKVYTSNTNFSTSYANEAAWKASSAGKVAKKSHSGSKVPGLAATCEANGWKDAWLCTQGCSKYYSNNTNNVLSGDIGNQDAYNTWKTNGNGKINKLNHTFSYVSEGNKITATCSNVATHTATLTLNASDGTYDGNAKTATIDGWSSNLDGLASKPTIIYKKQGETDELSGAPKDVGDYTASITVNSKTATKDFSITKKNIATDDVEITRADATYDGTPKPAEVTMKDSVSGMGDITVKYQKQNGSDWSEETDEEPVNAGTYWVVAHVSGGDNFNESYVAVKEFTISKASTEITNPPSFNNTISYGPTLNDITLGDDGVAKSGETEIPGTFAWKTGTTKPVVADSGTEKFAIVFTPTDSENYESSEKEVAFTVNKAHPAAPSAGVGYKIDYVNETLKPDPSEDFEVSSSNGETATLLDADKVEPGQTYYVRYKANGNQEKSDWTEINVAQRPAAPTVSVVVERMDNSITLQTISGVEYSIDGTNWFSATNAGSNVTVEGGKITFAGLTEDTDCTVYSRVKATNDAPNPHFHSDNTTQTVKTKKKLPDDLTTLFDFTPPEGGNPIYNKQPKEAEVKKKEPYEGIGTPVIKYYDKDGNEVENPTDAGDYTVKVSAPATPDYPAVPETKIGSFTIAKKQITITPNSNQSKVYGTLDPVITYTPYPVLFAGDTFTGSLTYEGADLYKNIGTYNIEIGTLSAEDNYELSLSPETFEIIKATYTQGPVSGVGYTIDYEQETLAPASKDFELGKKVGGTTSELSATPSAPESLTPILTPGNVSQNDLYFIRYKENSNQESSPWTAITIPARPAAPNVVDKQETVMNKKDAEITGLNSTMEYKFDGATGWTTVTGTKIANPENKKIAIRIKASKTNENFYGQEKTLVFTPSTTKLKVRIGDEIIEVPYGGTIPIANKPQDPTPPNGQVFMHWAFGDKEWIFDNPDTGTDDADASKVTDNITLVPVWGVEIHGTITALDYESITKVSLVDGKGNGYRHHDLEKQTDGTYKYSVIAPAGVDYNLVIEGKKKISGASHDITKTQLINLKQGGNGDIVMPAGVFNSKVTKENAGDYEHTLVGGLDKIADTHEGASDVVTVEMKVSADVTDDDKIKSAIKNKTLDFVELTLTKTTNNLKKDIGSTNVQLLEIIIPYNTAGKYNISVYRYHGNKVETLIPAKNIDGEYIKVGADTVTIYAMKFSTYAIGYSTTPPSSVSSDHNKSQEDDSNDSGSTPSGPSLPKKDTPAEKKPSDGLPKLIAKNTPKKDGNKEITDTNLLVSNTTGDEKDNPEKSEDVKDDPVVENDATQLEVGTSVPETEANKGSHRHHLLWLYLVLLILFCVARVTTKEKASTVKISLLAGDVVIAGLLLFVVKICVLSVIVCLAEIAVATVIHLLIKSKNQTANAN